jgi:AcrR family transcriptional regulator
VLKSTPTERLDRLVAAAIKVFASKGFRRTQIADIAAELGVSAGNVYNYVESKEALFHRCLVVASPVSTPVDLDVSLPIRSPRPEETRAVIDAGFAAMRRGGMLRKALAAPAPDDVAAELAGIIGHFFDTTSATRDFQALVERSAPDLPELFEAFFVRSRRPALAGLTSYLERRIASGHLRPVPDVATTARLIVEVQAWFARHRHRDQDAGDVSDELARATVIDVLVAGLLP